VAGWLTGFIVVKTSEEDEDQATKGEEDTLKTTMKGLEWERDL
jgi:hypothetical protein